MQCTNIPGVTAMACDSVRLSVCPTLFGAHMISLAFEEDAGFAVGE
jgi:hypothetical protein